MEYYICTIRKGAAGYVDPCGGAHIGGYPQLIAIKREGLAGSLIRKLREFIGIREACDPALETGNPTRTETCAIKWNAGTPQSEFVVEVPRTLDISPITGVSCMGEVVKMNFVRTGDMDCPLKVEDI